MWQATRVHPLWMKMPAVWAVLVPALVLVLVLVWGRVCMPPLPGPKCRPPLHFPCKDKDKGKDRVVGQGVAALGHQRPLCQRALAARVMQAEAGEVVYQPCPMSPRGLALQGPTMALMPRLYTAGRAAVG